MEQAWERPRRKQCAENLYNLLLAVIEDHAIHLLQVVGDSGERAISIQFIQWHGNVMYQPRGGEVIWFSIYFDCVTKIENRVNPQANERLFA